MNLQPGPTLRRAAIGLLTLALLAGCSGQVPMAELPQTGVTGPNGGAGSTIYYDSTGRAHFHT